MRLLPTRGKHGRPWSAARKRRGWLALWLQGRRRGRISEEADPELPSVPPLAPDALNAFAWWRADDAEEMGAGVYEWYDRREGYALFAAGSNPPGLSASGFNGQAALSLLGDDCMETYDISFPKPMSLFVVVAPTNDGSAPVNVAQCGSPGMALRVHRNGAGDIEWDSYYPGVSISVPGQFAVAEKVVLGGTATATEQKLFCNGVEPDMAQVSTPNFAGVEGMIVSSWGYWMTGLVAEVVLFDYALTQPQIDGLQSYFNERYGL